MAKIAVLLTVHNRRDLTLACLNGLQEGVQNSQFRVFLVDDGSTDGTSEAIRTRFPNVVIIKGNGSLYWNRGMRLAWLSAMQTDRFDFYLWMNDDLVLRHHAIDELVALAYKRAESGRTRTIVVGRLISPTHGQQTYGGLVRVQGLSRLRFRPARVDEAYCSTMNGNCVLIPAAAVTHIGLNSRVYRHSFGDVDYGLRAVRGGYKIVQHTSPVGETERNSGGYARPADRSFSAFRNFLISPKGMPLPEWFCFCFRHGGPLWLLNFTSMYLKAAIGLSS